MAWRSKVHRLVRPLYQAWSRLTRSGTLGVRALVLNAEGEVLLVEHSYIDGWFLPGGGVERGETAEAAVARELEEEAGVRPVGRPALVSVHANHRIFPGDHVLLFRVERWEACRPTSIGEIRARGWFAPERLPQGATAATRRRIAELLGGVESTPHW